MTTKLTKYFDLKAIDRTDLAENTRYRYKQALHNCLAANVDITNPQALADYAAGLPRSSRSFLKAAIRLSTMDLAQGMKASANPENIGTVQAALLRLEAINETIKVKATKGDKAHTWLSQAQVKQLMLTCDDSETGRRDWVILALMVAAGIRRDELANVNCNDLRDLPTKNGKIRWVIHVHGKGDKDRDIPVSTLLAERLRAWCLHIGQGNVARSLGRKKELGDSLSGVGVLDIVRKRGAMIGKPGLEPHDLRRTFAQLGYEAGIPLTQLSKLLGHSSVATTQRYLNLDLDLETTVSDFIPLE